MSYDKAQQTQSISAPSYKQIPHHQESMSYDKAQQTQSISAPSYKQIIPKHVSLTQSYNSKTNRVKDETIKQIPITCLVGQCSCTFVIEKDFCIDYGLDTSSLVIVEKRQEGLLIRKVAA